MFSWLLMLIFWKILSDETKQKKEIKPISFNTKKCLIVEIKIVWQPLVREFIIIISSGYVII